MVGTDTTQAEYAVHLRSMARHPAQQRMVMSTAKRIMVKAGRRSGKTVGSAQRAALRFCGGRRQLYAAPTQEQTGAFWREVRRVMREPIDAGVLRVNQTERTIELPGTEQRIKAKTAWNADMLRGDYADDLYLDEFQLIHEDAWTEVGAPMLADNNGDAMFIFTPPSLRSAGISKARDPRHASKLFRQAAADTTGVWETHHFTSLDNPFISKEGLALIAQDMSLDSYRREILAEDDEIEASWLVYNKFSESLCKVSRFEIPYHWQVYSGHDFGLANPAAIFLAQVQLPLPEGAPAHIRRGDLVAFAEYSPGASYSIADHVDAFKRLVMGRAVRSVGGSHGESEIRQGYTAHGWTIQEPAIQGVNPQVDRVMGLMEANKLFLFSDLWAILAQISNCMWQLDDDNRPKNKIADEAKYHLLAALRYIGCEFIPDTAMQRESVIKFY